MHKLWFLNNVHNFFLALFPPLQNGNSHTNCFSWLLGQGKLMIQVITMSQLVIISHFNIQRKFACVEKCYRGFLWSLCFGQIFKVLFLSVNLKAVSSAPVQTVTSLSCAATALCTPLPKLKHPQWTNRPWTIPQWTRAKPTFNSSIL